ncbi:zinc finger protein 384-like [Phymastichus coffea]|uniref:zinc finger protein 384-like n=1 Tax=Phymastichus coffea TaxID=108790 RepID=UPI00273CC7B6|nr:zinc finger protein 384-like [Phymastichus coffea]
MDFSFENINHPLFAGLQLDLFGISRLNAAAYEPPATVAAPAEQETPAATGKQKKSRRRRSSDGKPYPTIKCSECPKQYRDNNAGQRHLQLHMTTHDPDALSKFTCSKCAKTFPNEVYLKRHSNLCGVPRKRRSSVGSSTCDESSSDTVIVAPATADAQSSNGIATIDEEDAAEEVQIDFQAF